MRKIVLLVVALLLAVTSNSIYAANVVVSPPNMNGWAFYNTDNNFTLGAGSGTYGMVTGPATPPLELVAPTWPQQPAMEMRKFNCAMAIGPGLKFRISLC